MNLYRLLMISNNLLKSFYLFRDREWVDDKYPCEVRGWVTDTAWTSDTRSGRTGERGGGVRTTALPKQPRERRERFREGRRSKPPGAVPCHLCQLFFWIELVIVLAVIFIGARFNGVGLGIWGGVGLFLIAVLFGVKRPPRRLMCC